ncbi:MAG TPA: sugar transferase [Mucilaginibacter sp.]|jgi:lipopolysaccharide/colanic/teichoic acid biosynthesis glycosyltransferase
MDNYLLELKEDYEQSSDKDIFVGTVPTSNKNSKYIVPSIGRSPLLKQHNLIIKRLFDIIISITAIMLVLTWLLPLLAILIKIDSRGPIFFLQKRNKRDGGLFNCIKLRTMLVNDDAHSIAAVKNDSRITGLGIFLRLTHLDELPQFINVLMGDMSVIGPRPHMINENVKFKRILNFYDDRHLVKPGITGLAQSFGYHGTIDDLFHLDKKIAYDIFYINHWSVVMDVKILTRTIVMILKKDIWFKADKIASNK